MKKVGLAKARIFRGGKGYEGDALKGRVSKCRMVYPPRKEKGNGNTGTQMGNNARRNNLSSVIHKLLKAEDVPNTFVCI